MEYQPAPVSPPPQPEKKGVPKALIIVGGIFACICLGCAGFAAFGAVISQMEQKAYADGHAAYLAGDCATAITKFDSITGEDLEAQAQPERDHCQLYQQAKGQHDAGNFAAAADGYLDAAATNPGLDTTLTAQLDQLFSQASMDQLVSDGLCSDLTSISGSTRIPSVNTNAPDLYIACGNFLAGAQRFGEAADAFDLFLSQYPDHERASEAETGLASALLREAKAGGAGEIARPQISGSTGTGDAVVIIQNDSPEAMRIVFTGPETRIEELPACTDCITYSGLGPDACPELGPVGEYTVPPGTYEVLVESISDSGTTPFTGTWDLASGDEYSSCFYIVEGQ
jgi:outer membrane protein assembly factor BamD (BamD/ComL family)